jgi:hypothetical protein
MLFGDTKDLLLGPSLICGDFSFMSYTDKSMVGRTAFLEPTSPCLLTRDRAKDLELSDLLDVFIIIFSLLLPFLQEAKLMLTLFLNLFSLWLEFSLMSMKLFLRDKQDGVFRWRASYLLFFD